MLLQSGAVPESDQQEVPLHHFAPRKVGGEVLERMESNRCLGKAALG